MKILNNNNNDFSDHAQKLICPHCAHATTLILTSPPNYTPLNKYRPEKVGISYLCTWCKEPILLKYKISSYQTTSIHFDKNFEELEKPIIKFEFEYIPEGVRSDFEEALNCYSI